MLVLKYSKQMFTYVILQAIKTRCELPIKSAMSSGYWTSAAGMTNQWRPPLIDKEIVAQENQLITESQVTRLCEENHIQRLGRSFILSSPFLLSRGAEHRT
jgi:hypothetical protein